MAPFRDEIERAGWRPGHVLGSETEVIERLYRRPLPIKYNHLSVRRSWGSAMRDVAEINYEDMCPELRALITYEANGALDVAEPQLILDRIRKATPIVRWEFGLGFFELEDILAAGRNRVLVSTNPDTGLPMGMGSTDPLIPLHVDGDLHRHYRRLLDPLFTPKKMGALDPDIRKLADELIDGFVGNGRVELHAAFCVPLPSILFLRLFGMPLEDMEFLIRMKDRILKNEGTTFEQKEEIGVAAGVELRAHLRHRLDERRAEGSRHDDLLDQFMHFEIDGQRLADDEVANIMHMFTIAGLDTVTSSLSCILAWFAKHANARKAVVDDPTTLGTVIEELMRFESPVPSSGVRWATEDTDINGVPIRKGDLVYLCWAAGNLDPKTFEDPLTASIDRVDNRHIAFASGIHRCLGSHLARAELRAAVDQFHRRIPEYSVTEGEEIRYEFAGVRQAVVLPITFTAS